VLLPWDVKVVAYYYVSFGLYRGRMDKAKRWRKVFKGTTIEEIEYD
jgi:hypothetical protein